MFKVFLTITGGLLSVILKIITTNCLFGEHLEYAGLGILVMNPEEAEDDYELLDYIMEARIQGYKIIVENKPDVIRSEVVDYIMGLVNCCEGYNLSWSL